MRAVSFRVQAFLVNGVALDSRFGVALDSLLASTIREREKRELGVSGEEYDGGLNRFVAPDVKIVDLPLSKCFLGEEWHWHATCALPLGHSGEVTSVHDVDVRSYIQVDDNQGHERAVAKLPANISSSSGRWKLSRGVTPVTLAHSLSWTGHGDIDAVLEILEDVHSLGSGRRSGIGSIQKWTAEAVDMDMDDAGHIGIDGKIARPCFESCLRALSTPINKEDLTSTTAGFRPPYWHLGNQREVLIHTRK